MKNHECEILWGYLIELRKELVESQKIRTQVIGFKITFVTALIGFFLTKLLSAIDKGDEVAEYNYYLLIIPAIASLFFDFLIFSYGYSVKRIGLYIRLVLEPALKEKFLNSDVILWENFLDQPQTKQKLAKIGNLGLTTIAVMIAIISILWFSSNQLLIAVSILVLFILGGVEIWGLTRTELMVKEIKKNYEKTGRSTN
jgi:hypothetical protein